jgi:hypothetical protein
MNYQRMILDMAAISRRLPKWYYLSTFIFESLRTLVENREKNLDKEATSHYDPMDEFRVFSVLALIICYRTFDSPRDVFFRDLLMYADFFEFVWF